MQGSGPYKVANTESSWTVKTAIKKPEFLLPLQPDTANVNISNISFEKPLAFTGSDNICII